MHNNVVITARDVALRAGLRTLRFNFRGVGASGGVHDGGQGEVEDLRCAVAHAGTRAVLIGYSFGAWVAAHFLKEQPLPSILIAPPNLMFAFPPLQGSPVWAVCGEQDRFCRIEGLQEVLDPGRILSVAGVDHFWNGDEDILAATLGPLLEDLVSARPL